MDFLITKETIKIRQRDMYCKFRCHVTYVNHWRKYDKSTKCGKKVTIGGSVTLNGTKYGDWNGYQKHDKKTLLYDVF